MHAAHRVRRRFPDGQLYVDLLGATPAALTPGDVLARFLRDLGVDGKDIPVDEAERAARYRTALARRRMLVVLDNARDAAQVRPLLPGSASSAVLVTTRSRMPDLASTKLVDLNVLDDDEALKLFVKVVGEERAAAEPEATAELLDACAGLPLAIRICAARLVTRSGWTIRAMAGRLTDEHRRLDEMRAGDLAVRASFEVSFTSLPPSTDKQGIDPARAFCLLGLWQGPSISSAAAAALCGIPEYSAEDALEVLVDTHLLESVATDRYRFHDLLRVYAAERAADDLLAAERDAAVTRLLEWYLRAADAAATAVLPHRYDIPLDIGPTRHGITRGQTIYFFDPSGNRNEVFSGGFIYYPDNPRRLWSVDKIGKAVFYYQRELHPRFMRQRGNEIDGSHQGDFVSRDLSGTIDGDAVRMRSTYSEDHGDALGFTRHSEGIDCLERSLAIRREVGDRMGEAQSANNLADAYHWLGRTDEALELYRRALELNRAVGYRLGEGIALVNLGWMLVDLGRAGEAIDYLRQAREAFAEIDYVDGVGYALHILGRCHLSLGRDAEALSCLHEALASHRASGNRGRQAATLTTLGTAQNRLGLAAEARESWTQATAIFTELGDLAEAEKVRAEQAASGIS